MIKRPAESMEGSPAEKILPSKEIKEDQQDKLLELIYLGDSLLADRVLENRNSVSDATFYEVDGKISATPAGSALIGFFKSVERALAEYNTWKQSGGRVEIEFVNKIAQLTQLHNGLLHALQRRSAAGHGVTHTLSNHTLNYDGWSDLVSQGYTESVYRSEHSEQAA